MPLLTTTISICAIINIIFLFLLLDIYQGLYNNNPLINLTHMLSSILVILLSINYFHRKYNITFFLIELFFYYTLLISIHYISVIILLKPMKSMKPIKLMKHNTYKYVILISLILSIAMIIFWLENKIPMTELPVKCRNVVVMIVNSLSSVIPGIFTILLLIIQIFRNQSTPSADEILVVVRSSLAAILSITIQFSSDQIFPVLYSCLIITYTIGVISTIMLNDTQYSSILRSNDNDDLLSSTHTWKEQFHTKFSRSKKITDLYNDCAKDIYSYNRINQIQLSRLREEREDREEDEFNN